MNKRIRFAGLCRYCGNRLFWKKILDGYSAVRRLSNGGWSGMCPKRWGMEGYCKLSEGVMVVRDERSE